MSILLSLICAPFLAALFANSLRSVPMCTCVQARVTLLAIHAKLITASAVLNAVVDVNVLLYNASSAAGESEIIFIYICC